MVHSNIKYFKNKTCFKKIENIVYIQLIVLLLHKLYNIVVTYSVTTT